MVDADFNPRDRWRDVADELQNIGIAVPNGPVLGGACIPESTSLPRVGIWLMPDNESQGELEDFIRPMLPDGDPVWPSSNAYIDGISEEHRKFGKKTLRAKIHAWLATRKLPGRMGAAIMQGDLEADGELAARFCEWLRQVFG